LIDNATKLRSDGMDQGVLIAVPSRAAQYASEPAWDHVVRHWRRPVDGADSVSVAAAVTGAGIQRHLADHVDRRRVQHCRHVRTDEGEPDDHLS
jgi:hypothetical protein